MHLDGFDKMLSKVIVGVRGEDLVAHSAATRQGTTESRFGFRDGDEKAVRASIQGLRQVSRAR